MQRKNYILRRSGFAMMMAIILLVVIATIMAISVSMSTTTTHRTTNEYLHEQAILLTSSATEYAVLALSGHEINATNGCINSINALYPNVSNPMFDINITIQYIGLGATAPTSCSQYIINMATPESNGTVLMDVVVTDHNLSTEPIRYHRRTLQKL